MDGGAQGFTIICIFNVYLHGGVPSTNSSLQDKDWLAEGEEPEWFPAVVRPLRNLAVCMALPPAPSAPLVAEAFSDLRKHLRSCLPVGTDVHSGPPPGLPKAWYLAGADDRGRCKSPACPLSLHLAGMC